MSESTKTDYAAVLKAIVAPLLSQVDAFEATESRRDGAVTVSFRVHPDDTGRVIGKSGEAIRSIRAAVGIAAERASERVQIELIDG
jgi:predicted RNA-binding protein YlqC (UPF0109 family)